MSEEFQINYPHIASRIFDTPLMITQNKLDIILSVMSDKLNIDVPKKELGRATDNNRGRQYKSYEVIQGDTAVIPIHGTLVNRRIGLEALSGLSSYSDIYSQFIEAINDEDISKIVLDVDSHGGEVSGVFDLADAIYAHRDTKDIYAVVDEAAFSAGYLLASAASKIFTPRTAGVGSIGVVWKHIDRSAQNEKEGLKVTTIFKGDRKTLGSPDRPMTDDEKDIVQSHIDETYQLFVETVARNRGLDTKQVIDTKAGLFFGKSGVLSGLSDQVASANDAFREIVSSTTTTRKQTMSTEAQKAETGTAQQTSESQVDVAKLESNARNEGQTAGAQSERERINSILSLPEAEGREKLANELAFTEGMTAETAKKLLEASTPAQAAEKTPFEKEMGSLENPEIGEDVGGDGGDDAAKLVSSIVQNGSMIGVPVNTK